MSNPLSFDLIPRLVSKLPLSPETVAEALGTRIVRDAKADTPAVVAYAQAAGVKDSPYETVDLRMPDPDIGEGGGFLSVTLKSDGGVDRKAILDRFGLEFQADVPSPRYPPSVPAYLIFQQPWGKLSFGITNNEAAKLVRFIMEPNEVE